MENNYAESEKKNQCCGAGGAEIIWDLELELEPEPELNF